MDKAWITRPTVVPVTERERSFRLAIGCGDRFRWAARPTTTSPLSNAETRTSPGAAERPRRRSQRNALTGRMSPAGPAGAGDPRIGRCSPRGQVPPPTAAGSEETAARAEEKGDVLLRGCWSRSAVVSQPRCWGRLTDCRGRERLPRPVRGAVSASGRGPWAAVGNAGQRVDGASRTAVTSRCRSGSAGIPPRRWSGPGTP